MNAVHVMKASALAFVVGVAGILAAPIVIAGGGAPGKAPPKPPAPAPAPAAAGNGTVSGIVQDEEGKPLAGATIFVGRSDRKEPWKATSDAKGFYAVRGLPEGKANLTLKAKGRVAATQDVDVKATGITPIDDIKLAPGVRYTGKVNDTKGAPIGGVKITATRSRDGNSFFWFAPTSDEATSAADGTFVVDGLAPTSKYSLKFRHPHYVDAELPGLDAAAGGALEGIEAILEDAAWVTGTVVDPAGKPIVGARVLRAGDEDSEGQLIDLGGFTVLVHFAGAQEAGIRTDAKGKFEFGGVKPPEEGEALVIRVRADGFFPGQVRFETLEGGKEKSGVVIALETGKASVEGVVLNDLEKPVVGAEVVANSEENGAVGKTKTDADGKFRLEKLATKQPITIGVEAAGHADGNAEKVALESKDTRVVLRRLGKLKVKVLDDAGKIVPKVFVRRIVTEDGKEHPRSVDQLDQGANGLEIPLEPITIEVRVGAKGFEESAVGEWNVEPGQVIEGGEVKLTKQEPKPKKGADDGGDDGN